MAKLIRLSCGECDEPVTSHHKEPRYVHANRGVKYDHEVTEVLSEDITPKGY